MRSKWHHNRLKYRATKNRRNIFINNAYTSIYIVLLDKQLHRIKLYIYIIIYMHSGYILRCCGNMYNII